MMSGENANCLSTSNSSKGLGVPDKEQIDDVEHTEKETEWINFVDTGFAHRLKHRIKRTEAPRSSQSVSIFRIPPELKRLHERIYGPDLMVLGLLSELDVICRSSTDIATQFKLDMVYTFMEALILQEEWSVAVNGSASWDWKEAQAWEELQACIVQHPSELQDYYDLNESQLKSSSIICRVLTLDSVFLCTYLCTYLSSKNHSSTYQNNEWTGSVFHDLFFDIVFGKSSSFHNRIVDDITKLENQLPLPLIKRVLEVIYTTHHHNLVHDDVVQDELHTICSNWVLLHENSLPGIYTKDADSQPIQFARDQFQDCSHLLACLCRVMGSSTGGHLRHSMRDLRIEVKDLVASPPQDLMRDNSCLPSACKMHDCGIRFRGTGRAMTLVPRFERGFLNLSATLHIPSFCVLPNTETIWRNMIAFLRESTGNSSGVRHESLEFIFFMKFMDELIGSKDDVTLLRDGAHGVIQKNLLETNQQVADLINTVVHHGIPNINFYEESIEWLKVRHSINQFLKERKRIAVFKWLRHAFGKPWLAVSWVAGFLILFFLFLQMLYTMLGYYA